MSNLCSLAARLYHLLRPPVCVEAIRLVEGMSRAIIRRPGSQERDDGACARRGSGATIMRAELLLGRRMVSESISRAPTDLAHAQGEWVEMGSPHAQRIVPGWENLGTHKHGNRLVPGEPSLSVFSIRCLEGKCIDDAGIIRVKGESRPAVLCGALPNRSGVQQPASRKMDNPGGAQPLTTSISVASIEAPLFYRIFVGGLVGSPLPWNWTLGLRCVGLDAAYRPYSIIAQ
jgi:hypothetical protein